MTRNTILFSIICVACAVPTDAYALDPAVLEAQQKRVETIKGVMPSVVAIFGASGNGGGSGVLISSDGFALTNYHVTNGAGNFMKCGLNDGVLYDGVIVSIDPTGDVALIKLLGRNDFPFAKLGDSDKLRVGDFTFAMGNPFLLATDFHPTVTYGIVSGVHRYQEPAGNNFLEYTDCIQVDTSINPGNSGGPLFNMAGELVGINGRGNFEKRGRVNSGAGYAISINQIKHFMGHLKSGRVIDHATLGATVTSQDNGTVVVDNILEESEAFRRGLRPDDEIISFAGRPIRSVNQFKNVLGIYPKGFKVPIEFRRGEDRLTIYPRLRALHRKSDFQSNQPAPKPQPKPGEKPKDGEKPKPMPIAKLKLGPQPPEKYKHMYVKKEGFANYYFNELEQKRIENSLAKNGDFKGAKGKWTLAGTTGSGTEFTFTLDDKQVALQLGADNHTQPLDAETFGDLPRGTGGLLVSMHLLKSMVSSWNDEFGEFYYLGAEPLDGKGDMVDVVITTYLTVKESRWYFNQKTGALTGVDTMLTDDVDACEIRIEEFKEFDGKKIPAKFTVRSGEDGFGTYTVSNAKFEPAK